MRRAAIETLPALARRYRDLAIRREVVPVVRAVAALAVRVRVSGFLSRDRDTFSGVGAYVVEFTRGTT